MKDESNAPSLSVKTRFAPSPTGYIHLGNARVALINYALALQSKGTFLLRMEDTDLERSCSRYVEAIVEDLQWLGISWEGQVTFQSHRGELYRRKALELWSKGKAYPCFCLKEELEAHRRECLEKAKPPRYSGKCRRLSSLEVQARIAEGEPFSLRLRVDPKVQIRWKDLVKGSKRFKGKDLDDVILLRADGTPTYHLAVVVDDGEAGVTHVIRGEDHLSNTPYHILLFQAMDYPVPLFAHVPLVRAPEGQVLEKREGGRWTLRRLREEGYLPLAVVNLLFLLGWNPPHKPPLTWEEILSSFSLEDLSSSSVTFSPSVLSSINRRFLATMPLEDLLKALEPYIAFSASRERLREAVSLVRENASTLVELAAAVESLLLGPKGVNLEEEERAVLKALLSYRSSDVTWREVLEEKAGSMGKKEKKLLFTAMRKALMGLTHGPPMDELLAFLGEGEVTRRIMEGVED